MHSAGGATMSPDMSFGSTASYQKSRSRIMLAKKAVQNLIRNGKPQFRYKVDELINVTSPNYRKHIARCTVEERDQAFLELHNCCVIRVDAIGDILNPNVDPSNNKRFDTAAAEVYLITNPMFPGWVKCGQSLSPEKRAQSMNTGAPADYKVECKFELPRWMKDTDIHPHMEKVAGAKSREWFYMPLDVAEQVLRLALIGDEKEIRRMTRCDKPILCA